MNITVIGCGRWGCFLAWYLDRQNHCVTLYGRESSKRLAELKCTRKNKYMEIGESIALSSDLKCSVKSAECILISINAQNLRQFIHELSKFDLKDKPLVICMKGLEEETGKTLSRIIGEYTDAKTAVWVPGPVMWKTS